MLTNKIVLGTAQFGLKYGINNQLGQPAFDAVAQILEYAQLNHIHELDTAQAYGNSEEVLGQFVRGAPSAFKIQSKFSVTADFSFEKSLKSSLEKLGVSSIEGVYFHKYSDFKNYDHFNEIAECQKKGLFKNLGVSIYSHEELADLVNKPLVDMIQIPFNIFDRDAHKISLLKAAQKQNKKIYTRSAFLQGLMFMNEQSLPVKLKSFAEPISQVKALAEDLGISLSELCLGYVLRSEFVDRVIIGVDSLEQLKANVDCIDKIEWSTEFYERVDSELNKIKIEYPSLLNPVNWN